MGQPPLAKRRILITGVSRGIGRALARELAAQGTHLLLVARSSDALATLAEELHSAGAASVSPLAGDITNRDFRESLLQTMMRKWGALDTLVNNAGVSAHGRFAEHDEQVLRRIMEVNFFAAAELTRECLPCLKQGVAPQVVNVGSILGHRALPFNSEYCASKFALRGWNDALRTELLSQGIHVLLVSPGTVASEFFDHLLTTTDSLPWGKQQGIPPEIVARQIVRAMVRGKREIFPNWRGRLLVIANRWFPGVVERMISCYR